MTFPDRLLNLKHHIIITWLIFTDGTALQEKTFENVQTYVQGLLPVILEHGQSETVRSLVSNNPIWLPIGLCVLAIMVCVYRSAGVYIYDLVVCVHCIPVCTWYGIPAGHTTCWLCLYLYVSVCTLWSVSTLWSVYLVVCVYCVPASNIPTLAHLL